MEIKNVKTKHLEFEYNWLMKWSVYDLEKLIKREKRK